MLFLAGWVFLADAAVAETHNVGGDVKSERSYVSPNVTASPKSPKLDHQSARGNASPQKEPAKDLLRAKRPN
jgi:hypothetical protein